MTPHLHRARFLTAFAMPLVFFVGLDEASHGSHFALRIMGGVVALSAVVIFREIWKSYRDDDDDSEEDPG